MPLTSLMLLVICRRDGFAVPSNKFKARVRHAFVKTANFTLALASSCSSMASTACGLNNLQASVTKSMWGLSNSLGHVKPCIWHMTLDSLYTKRHYNTYYTIEAITRAPHPHFPTGENPKKNPKKGAEASTASVEPGHYDRPCTGLAMVVGRNKEMPRAAGIGTANNGHRICHFRGIRCRHAHGKEGKQKKQKSFKPFLNSILHNWNRLGQHGSNTVAITSSKTDSRQW